MVFVRYTPKGWNWTRDVSKTRKSKRSRNGSAFRIHGSRSSVPQDRPRPIRKWLTVALTPVLWFVLGILGIVILGPVLGAHRFVLGCWMATWFLGGLLVSAEIADRILSFRDRSVLRARLMKRRAARKAAAEDSQGTTT